MKFSRAIGRDRVLYVSPFDHDGNTMDVGDANTWESIGDIQ